MDSFLRGAGKEGAEALALIRAEITDWDSRVADQRTRDTMDAAPVLANPRRPTKEEQADKGVVNTVMRGSTNAAYLAARIKRDAPEIADAVSRGEFKSIRAAAIAAGIVRVKTPLDQLRHWWQKASQPERIAFIEHIDNQV